MPEIGKIELNDDELDKVSGGVNANEVSNCGSCIKIDMTKEKSCSNCYLNGNCTKQ